MMKIEALRSVLNSPPVERKHLEWMVLATDSDAQLEDLETDALIERLVALPEERAMDLLKAICPEALEGEVDEESIQTLRSSVERSSGLSRTIALTFVALMFYIFLIVASTTDLSLFLPESIVTLPVLDIQLNLPNFFSVTPFLIAIFHFNLLINLQHHQEKLQRLAVREGNQLQYHYLHPFLFNYLEKYDSGSFFRNCFKGFVQILLFWFPVFVILAMQYRFLAYHDVWRSGAQFAAFAIEGVICWYFHRIFFLPEKQKGWTIGKWFMAVGGGIFSLASIFLLVNSVGLHQNSKDLLLLDRGVLALDLKDYIHQINQVNEGLVVRYLNDSMTIEDARDQAILNHGEGFNLTKRDFRLGRMERINLSNVIAGEAIFDEALLNGAKFPGTRLDGASFIGTDLRDSYLANAVLNDANMQGVRLEGADLTEAKLNRVNMRGGRLDGAKFTGATIKNSIMAVDSLGNLDFSGTQLDGSVFVGVKFYGTNFTEANFPYCTLDSSKFVRVDFSGARFDGASMRQTKWTDCSLVGVNLNKTDFYGGQLIRVNFSDANLRSADFTNATLKEVNFRNAYLVWANLSGTDLAQTNLRGAELSHAQLESANLSRANLSGANLSQSNLTNANLRNARLSDADLTQANLNGATLTGANLKDANLTSVILNAQTQISPNQISQFKRVEAIVEGDTLSGKSLKAFLQTITVD